ncbi:hypothetical protein FHR32_000952 [Streptosporangium album]|uniref:Uncharacterized protein n=1 Tax=Streptosporangium album TaxID=47479 RepID=A0A7W7RR59_9ACTN|nr:hypothetical protein [Streptosporangium album]
MVSIDLDDIASRPVTTPHCDTLTGLSARKRS